MKTTIVALSAAAFIATGPVGLAQGASGKTVSQQHKVSKQHGARVSAALHGMSTKGFAKPLREPVALDRETEMSRKAGGGGGGGSGM